MGQREGAMPLGVMTLSFISDGTRYQIYRPGCMKKACYLRNMSRDGEMDGWVAELSRELFS
jgi:hypothetical protein